MVKDQRMSQHVLGNFSYEETCETVEASITNNVSINEIKV